MDPIVEMLLAGEVLRGEEAHRLGLVQRVGGLDDALAWAEAISALAPLSIAGHKQAMRTDVDGHGAQRRKLGQQFLAVLHVRVVRLVVAEETPDGLQRPQFAASIHVNRDGLRAEHGHTAQRNHQEISTLRHHQK